MESAAAAAHKQIGSDENVIEPVIDVSYQIEEDPSVLDKLKSKFHNQQHKHSEDKQDKHQGQPPEITYEVAAAATREFPSKEELKKKENEKILRGEELGTGYEEDSEASSK